MIQLRGINKIYQRPGGKQEYGLKNINLKIGKGEFAAIVGPSGAGKTTLMNILGCLDKPTSGSYTIKGQELSERPDKEISAIRNKEISFIFQSYNLLTKLNAIENVELPLVYRKVPLNVRRVEAYKALCQVGLQDRLFHKPSHLSGGQQQRVAIARTLVAKPSVILADEPTGALDQKTRNEILTILKDLVTAWGITVVIVTHDMDIADMATRVVKIDQGMIIEDY